MTRTEISSLTLGELRDLIQDSKSREGELQDYMWERAFGMETGDIPPVMLAEGRDNEGAFYGPCVAFGGDISAVWVYQLLGERWVEARAIFEGDVNVKLDALIPSVPIPLHLVKRLLEGLDKAPHEERCLTWGQELKAWLESQPYFNWPPRQETQQEGNQE